MRCSLCDQAVLYPDSREPAESDLCIDCRSRQVDQLAKLLRRFIWTTQHSKPLRNLKNEAAAYLKENDLHYSK